MQITSEKIKILLLITLLFNPLALQSKNPYSELCSKTGMDKCPDTLLNYPLFDTEYKVAANYVPVAALRAFAHANLYREKRKLHMRREFYVRNLRGELAKPYEVLDLDIEVKAKGLFGRKLIAKGKLNEFDFEYINEASFSLPKTAKMKAHATLDKIVLLYLDMKSEGTNQVNEVEGQFLGHEVKYKTHWRDTQGILAGYGYNIYVEGIHPNENEFSVSTKGVIGKTEIKGHGKLIEPNHYQTEEFYGPIIVKTDIKLLEQ